MLFQKRVVRAKFDNDDFIIAQMLKSVVKFNYFLLSFSEILLYSPASTVLLVY